MFSLNHDLAAVHDIHALARRHLVELHAVEGVPRAAGIREIRVIRGRDSPASDRCRYRRRWRSACHPNGNDKYASGHQPNSFGLTKSRSGPTASPSVPTCMACSYLALLPTRIFMSKAPESALPYSAGIAPISTASVKTTNRVCGRFVKAYLFPSS